MFVLNCDPLYLSSATTCWYTHPTFGPVYAGTLSYTTDYMECQTWALNTPQVKTSTYEPDSMYPSDNNDKTRAKNYCRIFNDDYYAVWCYWNQASGWFKKYSDCDVPRCGVVPGQRLP